MDWALAQKNIYRITDHIYLGPFPDVMTFPTLKDLGVSVVLNVSGKSYSHPNFRVTSIDIADLKEMHPEQAIDIANLIRNTVLNKESIFVHCVAGQNRSPGSVFLGLIALGYTEDEAASLIAENTLDAIPRHRMIFTDKVIAEVKQAFGAQPETACDR